MHAQEVYPESVVAYACDSTVGRFELKLGGAPTNLPGDHLAAKSETINTGSLLLVKSGKRAGSRRVTRACGIYTIEISDGYFNSDPGGELGSVDFPVVVIFEGKRSLSGRVAMGSCSKPPTMTSPDASECPENWATKIDGYPVPAGTSGRIQLTHAYEETR